MKVSFRLIVGVIIIIYVFISWSVQKDETTESEITEVDAVEESSTEESEDLEAYDEEFFIEDYDESSWEGEMFAVEMIRDVFILKERYYNHEFNYGVLVESLGNYFDIPKTFMKPNEAYGFIDPDDYDTIVTNEDTVGLTDIEFKKLLEDITAFSYSSDISVIDADKYEYKAIQSVRRRFFISPIIESDDNSVVVYIKELKSYNNFEVLDLPFDTVVTDYWFLIKRDSGLIYSHKNWTTDGYESELMTNLIHMREETLEMDMYEITDSILEDIR